MGQTPLYQAISMNDVDIIKFLINENADIYLDDCRGWTLLHLAAWSGSVETLELLIDQNINISDINIQDNNGDTPLHLAVRYGHSNVADFLINKNYGIIIDLENNDKKTPLHLAAMYAHINIVNWLLKKNANINSLDFRGNTPFDYAIKKNCKKMIEMFKKKLL